MQEQYENQEEGQIDLLEIIHVMLRKWWLIVLCGIIGCLLYTSPSPRD